LGYLLGLVELGLVNRTRYITGISGGSWATAVFSYAQLGRSVSGATTALTELELLGGPSAPPAALTADYLKVMPPASARKAVTSDFIWPLAKKVLSGNSPSTSWADVAAENFLNPVGVSSQALFSWDASTVKDAVSRNPAVLSSRTFVTPRAGNPFPILGIALLGPESCAPFKQSRRQYTLLEATPLYSGVAVTNPAVTFFSDSGKTATAAVGGQVESWALGTAAPSQGLGSAAHGFLTCSSSAFTPYTLRQAIGASSFFPGGYIAGIGRVTADMFALKTAYFSPADKASPPQEQEFLLGDGGNVENPHLIGMLQRRMKKVVMFCNWELPLAPVTRWNPSTAAPSVTDLDDDIPAFFGIIATGDTNKTRGYYLEKNTVFRAADFPPVAVALQRAQLGGKGAVVTTPLVTVANEWYGIPDGLEVNVTWVYLSRTFAWEQQLPADIRSRVVPSKNPEDPSSLMTSGEFKGFPHYSTDDLSLTASKANLLASLTAWTVHANADQFRAALS
jgi:hypothetical protein